MWLLGSTAKGDLKGIADYFQTPLKVALFGGSGSGDSSSVVQGGGEDLRRTFGQVKKGETASEKKTINLQRAQGGLREAGEARSSKTLKGELEALIEATPTLKQFKNQLLLDLTTEGLRIQIVDEKNRPMFDSASSELKPYTRDILREIGRASEQGREPHQPVGTHRRHALRRWRQGFRQLGALDQSRQCFAPRIGGGRHGRQQDDARRRPRLDGAVRQGRSLQCRSTGASASSC